MSNVLMYDDFYKGLRSLQTSPPSSKSCFVLKQLCNDILGLFSYRSILIVHQPCILVCIGKLMTISPNSIGRYTYTMFYRDLLLFSLIFNLVGSYATNESLVIFSHPPMILLIVTPCCLWHGEWLVLSSSCTCTTPHSGANHFGLTTISFLSIL
jgi:hypothetical protein